MSWRDRLQPGSFRGVPFHTQSASGQGGRNVVVHEFPQREDHETEDMGKAAGGKRLTVFLVGDDYDIVRKQLMDALDQSGPGKLIHPYLGTSLIQVQGYDWTISSKQGGYCQFNINYVSAGKRRAPAAVSTANELAAAITSAQTVNAEVFTDVFSVESQPEFVSESSTNFLEDAFSQLNSINGAISAELNQITDIANDIDSLTSEVTDLIKQPSDMVNNVGAVVASLIGAYNEIGSAFTAYNNMQAAFAITSPISRTAANGTTTSTRTRMADNQAALSLAMGAVIAFALAGRLAAANASEFDSLQQAREIRDALLDQLDSQLESDSLTSDQYAAITTLATALQRHINALEPGVLSAQYIVLDSSMPALVIAHMQYGDASRADELASRNGVENPLFMPAGEPIEVLV